MYPLAHLGIGLIIASLFYLPVAAFVLGVFLPDIVDKGLTILGVFESGRFFGHTILFALGAGFVTLVITRKKSVALAIMLGSLLHLVQDSAHFVPYFFPFIQYEFATGPVVFQPGNFEIAMEFVGAALIIFWWRFRSKLFYLRERILKLERLDDVVNGRAKRKIRAKKKRNTGKTR